MDLNTFQPEGKASLLRKALAQHKNITSFWIFSFSSSLKFNSTLVLWYNKSSSFLSKDSQSFNSTLSKTNLQILPSPSPSHPLSQLLFKEREHSPILICTKQMNITEKKEKGSGGGRQQGEGKKKKRIKKQTNNKQKTITKSPHTSPILFQLLKHLL